MESNVRVVIIRVVKVVLVTIAILIGLASVGIDITVLGVFGGAIGVGLGFGLQKLPLTTSADSLFFWIRASKSETW